MAETEPDRDGLDDADEQQPSARADHLDDVDDGCGCTEIWEHLSDRRED